MSKCAAGVILPKKGNCPECGVGSDSPCPVAAREMQKELDALRAVFDAAYGLCHGYDWNNGTAAKACGYRRKLLSAVNAIKEVPDFEGKYLAMSPSHRGSHDLSKSTTD